MNRLSILTGFSLLALFMIWVMYAGGSPAYFLDIPSVILFFGIVTGGLWACFGPSAVISAIFKAFASEPEGDPKIIVRNLAVLKRGYSLSWAAGILCTLAGLIVMLQNMDDPAKIGPGLAVALLTLIYGAVLGEFGFNLLHQITVNNIPPDMEGVVQSDHEKPIKAPPTMLFKGTAVIMLILCTFGFAVMSVSEVVKEQQYSSMSKSIKSQYVDSQDGEQQPSPPVELKGYKIVE